jgi:hypothetical protein
VGFVTVRLTVLEVLAVSFAAVVGVKTAVKELAPIVVNAVVTQEAVPELTVTGLQASVVLPTLKVTVPIAAAGERAAVRVTLAPEGAVVTTTLGAEVSAADSVVVVVACDTVTVDAAEVLEV